MSVNSQSRTLKFCNKQLLDRGDRMSKTKKKVENAAEEAGEAVGKGIKRGVKAVDDFGKGIKKEIKKKE